MAFSEYADLYDLYYAQKDYAAEVDFVLKLASRFGVTSKTLLDMGCGTGRHMEEFVNRGLKCDGFDMSVEMLSQARIRLEGKGVNLSEGNITDFENSKQYNIIVAMFAVMGYLANNNQLLAGLKTAHKHLEKDGIFIFDGWFGPAVLSQKPEKRCHEYDDGQATVTRAVTPCLDPVRQTVTAQYHVFVKRDGQVVRRMQEDHVMRFMFVQEMAFALGLAGLKLVHYCPFLEPDGELSVESWNVAFVAQRT